MSKAKNNGGRPPKYPEEAKKRGLTATDKGWQGLRLLASRYNMSCSAFLDAVGRGAFHVVPNNEGIQELFETLGVSNLSELLEKISSEETVLAHGVTSPSKA